MEEGEDVLNDLGGNHLAGTAPGGEAVEDDETGLLDRVVPLGLFGQVVDTAVGCCWGGHGGVASDSCV